MPLEEVTPDSPLLKQAKSRTLSLRWLMALVFGGLVGLSIFIVLAVSVYTNFTNTFSLLSESTLATMSGMESRIRDQGKQAENVLESIQIAYKRNNLNLEGAEEQQVLFDMLMTAAPIVEGIFVYRTNGTKTGIIRRRDGSSETYIGNRQEDPEMLKAMNVNSSRAATGLLWGNPVVIHGISYINLSVPLVRNEKLEAVAVALIGTNAVNRVVSQLGEDNAMTVFVMDQQQNLIAHSRKPILFAKQSSYRLFEFPDEILASFDTAKVFRPFKKAADAGVDIRETDGREGTIFMLKNLTGYSNQPLILGAYVNKVDVGDEIFRAAMAALVGLVMMVIAVIIAVLIGARLAKPLSRIANAAVHFSNFELEKFERLPGSRVTEINSQANALNSLNTAMSEFSHYVPRSIVKRLIDSGVEGTRSVEREVTIMFTDIVGFTSLSEHLNAVETANLLNSHFTIVCEEINRTSGTIDKFMGDNVMAFWGAPNADRDHADHAVQAAIRITEKLEADNALRRAAGLQPIRIRVGIHTGRAVVGNIGGGDRQNYTIVGDSVNIAQRLEQLGKEKLADEDVVVLMSSETAKAINPDKDVIPAGSWTLRGREKPITVYALAKGKEFAVRMESETNRLTASAR